MGKIPVPYFDCLVCLVFILTCSVFRVSLKKTIFNKWNNNYFCFAPSDKETKYLLPFDE